MNYEITQLAFELEPAQAAQAAAAKAARADRLKGISNVRVTIATGMSPSAQGGLTRKPQ